MGRRRPYAPPTLATLLGPGEAHDRELDSQELSSLCSAARAIAQEVYSARRVYSPTDRSHPLIIDGRDCGIEHGGLPVIGNSRAARLLNKDPRAFGAAVKQLYLSGSAGGVELRELLAYNESMDNRPAGARLRRSVWWRDANLREGRARCCGLTPQPGRARGLRA